MAEAAISGRGSALVLWLTCQALRRPRLLRWVASLLRRWPILSRFVPVLARRDAVVRAFERSGSFSNTAHAPNLVAGEFVIGIQDGPRYASERRTVEKLLRSSKYLGQVSAALGRKRLRGVQAGSMGEFDLVDDYLAPVVWQTLQRCFGEAAAMLTSGGLGGHASAAQAQAQLIRELRHLGSHLLIGKSATSMVQGRAEAAAAAVLGRVTPQLGVLRAARPQAFKGNSDNAVRRSAIGLMWVAHPATVQACGNVMLELMARPALYDRLRAAVQDSGAVPWTNLTLRAMLRPALLELLRFRPPFPLLVRDVPRASLIETGDLEHAPLKAGRPLTLMVIGALFDPAAVKEPNQFCPDRNWLNPEDPKLVFGFGPRSCPAKEHVLEMLVSLMIGLLNMPRLSLAGPWWRRGAEYDGPALEHMRLRY